MVTKTPELVVTWAALPDDFVLPDDPVDNIQQPHLAAALNDALGTADRIQPDMIIATDFGIVAMINQETVIKAPDWVYVPQVLPVANAGSRRSYTPNLQGDPVAVVMEFLSETEGTEYSIRSSPPYGKMYFYETILQVPTYIIFDPINTTLEVRLLRDGRYSLLEPTPEGRYWIPELGLFLGIWHGTRLGITMDWLRWWDEAGKLLLWGTEQAEVERERAEDAIAQLQTLQAKMRELGIE
jgi:Uma2 family endonuclease